MGKIMEAQDGEQAWLSGYRVLDLTGEMGDMCGWVLGSWGADVIKIEKPGGERSRNIGPFYHDIPDPEKSLSWFAYNSNKRGITLNLESTDGRALFRRLASKADFVLESFSPGYLDELGLGYSSLCQINQGVIMVSVTPFGQSGPYRDYKGTDLVASAMSGLLYLSGDPENPPVKMSSPMAYPLAAVDGAVGALIALYHRVLSGEGQHVDVSAQQSLAMCTFNLVPIWLLNGVIIPRMGNYHKGWHGSVLLRKLWPCRDGHVCFILLGRETGGTGNRTMVEWMKSEGMAEPFLFEIDWEAFNPRLLGQERVQQAEECIGRFFMKHTMKELYEGAIERKIGLCPVNSPKGIYEDPQLEARGCWATVEHPELGTSLVYPKPLVKVTGKECDIWRRAPLIGEHNQEIYEQELGLSRQDVLCLEESGVI
ncbi:CaiB/BaiF CoA transferase family protein [Chloroflexota bacterium]